VSADHGHTEPTDLLCGHWTFFRLGDDPDVTARCDLPASHDRQLHKFWWNRATGESFSWANSVERHERRAG
jgi:hypothetical protein